MEEEYKAKVVQIREEKKKNYEYLNLVPIEIWNEQQKKSYKNIMRLLKCSVFMGVILFIFQAITLIFNFNIPYLLTLAIILIFGSLIIARIYEDYILKDYDKKWWSFELFRINKPHNFKEGDIIKIKLSFEKEL